MHVSAPKWHGSLLRTTRTTPAAFPSLSCKLPLGQLKGRASTATKDCGCRVRTPQHWRPHSSVPQAEELGRIFASADSDSSGMLELAEFEVLAHEMKLFEAFGKVLVGPVKPRRVARAGDPV